MKTRIRFCCLLLLYAATSSLASGQDPVKVDPGHYRVLFENAHMRVLETRDRPGDKEPMHSHPSFMTYTTGPVKTKFTLPDGSTFFDEGDSPFECLPPTRHATENASTRDRQELIVEFKDALNPCSGAPQEASAGSIPMTNADSARIAGAEAEVRALQDALIDAYIRRDTAAMDRLLGDEYMFINDDEGVVATKKQILDSFKSGGDRKIISYKRQDDRVRVYGDVGVLTYRYQSEETYKGQYNGGDFWVTRIFVRRGGRWQIMGGQETRVSGLGTGVRSRLIGTWRLISDVTVKSDGSVEPFPEYGPHPIGYLMYDTTGHMCVTLSNPNPPRWANPARPSDAERAMSHKAMEAYCGTYEVREKESQVIHRPEVAEWPHYIGTDQVRNFRLQGNRLILSLEETPPNGERHRYEITWQRVATPSQ